MVRTRPLPARPPVVAPAPRAQPTSSPSIGATHRAAASVVVRPGDSLWTIAARRLGRRATPTAVAASWPRWWATNRSVIGANPDLIHPGQRLTPPHHDLRRQQ
ncbi:MAG: LysM peptidoglycan-binding domain-containing protein [Frankiales bacterium]|nr:LysM peptidoglycan-binding domain-containing protein [Frankiales bacterium]